MTFPTWLLIFSSACAFTALLAVIWLGWRVITLEIGAKNLYRTLMKLKYEDS